MLIVFLIYALVGPPVGVGLVALCAAFADLPANAPHQWGPITSSTFGFLIAISLASYLLGGFQAVVVGIVAALSYQNSISGKISIVATVVASMIGAAMFVFTIIAPNTFGLQHLSWAAIMVAAHVVAALACWVVASLLIDRMKAGPT